MALDFFLPGHLESISFKDTKRFEWFPSNVSVLPEKISRITDGLVEKTGYPVDVRTIVKDNKILLENIGGNDSTSILWKRVVLENA